jgi:hypothetical protein
MKMSAEGWSRIHGLMTQTIAKARLYRPGMSKACWTDGSKEKKPIGRGLLEGQSLASLTRERRGGKPIWRP